MTAHTPEQIEQLAARLAANLSDVTPNGHAIMFSGVDPAEPTMTHGDLRQAVAALRAYAEGMPREVVTPAYGIIDPDYARVFTKARCIAWAEGYALMMHGSFTRDLDLLAVPWRDGACEPEHLINRIVASDELRSIKPYGPSSMPHGRLVWTLTFTKFGDPRFIDIGVMPRLAPSPSYAEVRRDALEEAAPVLGQAEIDYIARFGPPCRDCADDGPVCPTTGIACSGHKAAAEHAVAALNYGWKHGFLTPSPSYAEVRRAFADQLDARAAKLEGLNDLASSVVARIFRDEAAAIRQSGGAANILSERPDA